MFGTVLTAGVTLLQTYVFWRLASLPIFRRRGPRAALWTVGLVLWSTFLTGWFYGHGRGGDLALMLESGGMIWMVVVFLTAVCVLIVDAATGFGAFFPRAATPLRSAAFAAGLLLSAVAFIQGHRSPVIESFTVPVAGLPPELEGKTLIALSDLHFGPTLNEAWLTARVKQVMAERPDMVVLLGDVVEGDSGLDEKFASSMSGLSAPLGVWGVLGNHESHGPVEENVGHLAEAGVRVLRNTRTEIVPGLVLAGVNNLTSREENGHMLAEFTQTLHGRPSGIATILLSHAPVGAARSRMSSKISSERKHHV